MRHSLSSSGFERSRSPGRRAVLSALVLLFAAFGMAVRQAHASGSSSPSELRAAFILRFPLFVDWPGQTFPTVDAPLVIGVLGDDFLASALESLAGRAEPGPRPVEVRRVRTPADLAGVHLAVIGPHDHDRWASALSGLRDRPVLTVGEGVPFAESQGILAFFIENNRLRIALNPTAARRAGLTFSSRLAALSRIVGVSEDTP